MTKPTWICAGCDDHFPIRSLDEFRFLCVEIYAVIGASRLKKTYELCPACQVKIVKWAQPDNWPRTNLNL